MNTHILKRVADWHGEQAAKAYRDGNVDDFARHTMLADYLWRMA